MAIVYHGTTKENLNRILTGEGKQSGPWTVSDLDNMMYFWNQSKLLESGEDIEIGIDYAFDAASTQAALKGENTELYVLECEINDSILEDDYSCENMEMASCINISDFNLNMIKKVYKADFNKWHAPYHIAWLLGNMYFNQSQVIDETLLDIAQTIRDTESYNEELFNGVDYEECTIF